MKKRDFLTASAGAMAAAAYSPVMAQNDGVLRPGKNYRVLRPPQRTQVAAGKLEVIEFFWVGCPHCRAMEPVIDQWATRIPEDVELRKVHVNYRTPVHQQIFYTLVAMKEDHRLTVKVFDAIHDERKRLLSEDEAIAWAESQDLDSVLFKKTYRSFTVKTSMRKASQQVEAFGVDSVPAMAVAGRFYTSPSMAGSNGRAMQVVDALLDLVRKGA